MSKKVIKKAVKANVSLNYRNKILVTILAITVASLLILSAMVVEVYKTNFEEKTIDILKMIAYDKKNQIEQNIHLHNEIVESIVSITSIRHNIVMYSLYQDPDVQTQLNEVINEIKRNSDILELSIVDLDANIIASTTQDMIGKSISEESYFQGPITGKELVDYVEYADTKGLFFSKPLVYDDKIIGLILIIFYDEQIDTQIEFGKTGEFILAKRDKNGDAIFINSMKFNPESAFTLKVTKDQLDVPITQALLKKSDIFYNLIDYRGNQVLSKTEYIESQDWGLVIKQDKSEIFEPVESFQKIIQILLIIIILFAIIISTILASKLTNPIVQFKESLRYLENGDYEQVINLSGNDEIGSVSKSIKTLQTTLAQNKKINDAYDRELEHKLEETQVLRLALDESSIIATTDKDGVIVDCNKQFEEISQYSRKEVIGKTHRLIKSDYHSHEFYIDMWSTITNGKIWKGDIKNKAKDGSFYWVKTVIVPVLGEDKKPIRYIAIKMDITTQKDSEVKLNDALSEVKRSEKLKSEFSSMVSHELKTPLTPIRGYCEILIEQEFGKLNNEQLDFIKTIDSNAWRLEKLIEDVLDVQKLDMNRMSFLTIKVSISKFLEEIKNDYILTMKEKQIQFKVDNSMDMFIQTDPLRLRQVFDNLIRNAIDFVDINGQIKIGIIEKSDEIVFFVKDNGAGIAKNKQENVFGKFYQVDTSQTRKHGGTGLGLVICKGIIERQQGKIWLESEIGKGTTVYFSIIRN
jgi:PAS domain S-box-containing protein